MVAETEEFLADEEGEVVGEGDGDAEGAGAGDDEDGDHDLEGAGWVAGDDPP